MSYLGQATPEPQPVAQPQPVVQMEAPGWATGVASIVDPLARATNQIYTAKLRADIDEARLKAGLQPMLYAGQVPLPPPRRRGLSTTSLLVGLVVVGGVLYIVSQKDASK